MNLNERVASLETLAEENGKTLWRVHEAIYGNGKPGMHADIVSIKRTVMVLSWLVGIVIAAAGVVVAVVK